LGGENRGEWGRHAGLPLPKTALSCLTPTFFAKKSKNSLPTSEKKSIFITNSTRHAYVQQ